VGVGHFEQCVGDYEVCTVQVVVSKFGTHAAAAATAAAADTAGVAMTFAFVACLCLNDQV
jgi:hypothetical protein